MMENLAEDQGPSLFKKEWNPKSFSNRTVGPEKLHILIEAARNTPSYKNEQPWNFIIVTTEDAYSYSGLLECLTETSVFWARRAPVLMLSVARLNFESDGARNKHAFHDLTRATTNIALRAKFLGLLVRQIAGFDAAMVRRRFQIPEGHHPVGVIVLGYPLYPPSARGDDLQGNGAAGPLRSIESIAFAGKWGHPVLLPKVVPCP